MAGNQRLDAVIVGAGFAGLFMLHRLRQLGMVAVVLEAASGVGGTWYWNRYPGARCDVESMQYSYSFHADLEQDWHWTERYATQPEILRYANHVAERLDLLRDIRFDTRVTAARFDESSGLWRIETEASGQLAARFCIMATGCLSVPKALEVPGVERFAGPSYHTGQWPHEGVDFSGQRVAIIGTGSTAIQAIPVIAQQAAHLTVFQRTPNFSVPAMNRPLTPEYEQDWKSNYPERRNIARQMPTGTYCDIGARLTLSVSPEERAAAFEARWGAGGFDFLLTFYDLILDPDANEAAAEFARAKIRAIVRNPETAAALCPADYPIGTKRLCVDTDYFETYNRDNVTLVDLRRTPLTEIVPEGVRTTEGLHAVDSLVLATGFDAMTGALARIAITGRGGASLADKWHAGPHTFLGLMTAGFPNLFMLTGPGSPSVLSNMMVSIEQHVEFTGDLLAHMAKQGATLAEPEPAAEDAWGQEVDKAAHRTLYPRAASWYMGANVPGKPRVFLPYIGGVGVYRDTCDDIARRGYPGLRFAA